MLSPIFSSCERRIEIKQNSFALHGGEKSLEAVKTQSMGINKTKSSKVRCV